MQESVEYNSMCGIKNNLHNVNQIYTGLWLCSMWLCSNTHLGKLENIQAQA